MVRDGPVAGLNQSRRRRLTRFGDERRSAIINLHNPSTTINRYSVTYNQIVVSQIVLTNRTAGITSIIIVFLKTVVNVLTSLFINLRNISITVSCVSLILSFSSKIKRL